MNAKGKERSSHHPEGGESTPPSNPDGNRRGGRRQKKRRRRRRGRRHGNNPRAPRPQNEGKATRTKTEEKGTSSNVQKDSNAHPGGSSRGEHSETRSENDVNSDPLPPDRGNREGHGSGVDTDDLGNPERTFHLGEIPEFRKSFRDFHGGGDYNSTDLMRLVKSGIHNKITPDPHDRSYRGPRTRVSWKSIIRWVVRSFGLAAVAAALAKLVEFSTRRHRLRELFAVLGRIVSWSGAVSMMAYLRPRRQAIFPPTVDTSTELDLIIKERDLPVNMARTLAARNFGDTVTERLEELQFQCSQYIKAQRALPTWVDVDPQPAGAMAKYMVPNPHKDHWVEDPRARLEATTRVVGAFAVHTPSDRYYQSVLEADHLAAFAWAKRAFKRSGLTVRGRLYPTD